MANGDFCTNGLDANRYAIKLLDAQSATSNGVWVEIPTGFNIRSFHASASESGATLDVMVSNAATIPADATDGPISMTLNGTTLAGTTTEGFRWVKCKKTAGGTPAASTVIIEASRSN